MVKYNKQRKSLRRTRKNVPKTRKQQRRRQKRRHVGGYSPVGVNGGNYGVAPKGYPVGQTGELPDPVSAFPIGQDEY